MPASGTEFRAAGGKLSALALPMAMTTSKKMKRTSPGAAVAVGSEIKRPPSRRMSKPAATSPTRTTSLSKARDGTFIIGDSHSPGCDDFEAELGALLSDAEDGHKREAARPTTSSKSKAAPPKGKVPETPSKRSKRPCPPPPSSATPVAATAGGQDLQDPQGRQDPPSKRSKRPCPPPSPATPVAATAGGHDLQDPQGPQDLSPPRTPVTGRARSPSQVSIPPGLFPGLRKKQHSPLSYDDLYDSQGTPRKRAAQAFQRAWQSDDEGSQASYNDDVGSGDGVDSQAGYDDDDVDSQHRDGVDSHAGYDDDGSCCSTQPADIDNEDEQD